MTPINAWLVTVLFPLLAGAPALDEKPDQPVEASASLPSDAIVFLQFSDIFVTMPEGEPRQLTNDGPVSDEQTPRLSPDRKMVAFIGGGRRPTDLMVIGSDGTGAVTRFEGKSSSPCREPVWSPDGQWIAFVAGPITRQDIYVVSRDGKTVRNLTDDRARNHSPTWSPDGKRLAFIAGARPQPGKATSLGNLNVVDLDGKNRQALTTHDRQDAEPAWSPDGKSILFASKPVHDRDGTFFTRLGVSEVLRVQLSGGEVERASDRSDPSRSPAWAPDGESFVFIGRKPGDPSVIYRVDAEGKELALAQSEPRSEFVKAVWLPDGKAVVVHMQRGGVFLVPVDGSEMIRLSKTGTHPDCASLVGARL